MFEVAQLGRKLTKANLTEQPLLVSEPAGPTESIRADTVHQAKGESLDAVLFLAKKPQIEALLSDDDTENRRIGYVAITRARHLFVLGIPKSTTNATKIALEAIGLEQLPAEFEKTE